MLNIRPMLKQDIDFVAIVHSKAFQRQCASREWVTCNFSAYPIIMMYVAVNQNNGVIGFIQWLQKNGFRNEAVIELGQMAVPPAFQ